jgi:hypothetical protein
MLDIPAAYRTHIGYIQGKVFEFHAWADIPAHFGLTNKPACCTFSSAKGHGAGCFARISEGVSADGRSRRPPPWAHRH